MSKSANVQRTDFVDFPTEIVEGKAHGRKNKIATSKLEAENNPFVVLQSKFEKACRSSLTEDEIRDESPCSEEEVPLQRRVEENDYQELQATSTNCDLTPKSWPKNGECEIRSNESVVWGNMAKIGVNNNDFETKTREHPVEYEFEYVDWGQSLQNPEICTGQPEDVNSELEEHLHEKGLLTIEYETACNKLDSESALMYKTMQLSEELRALECIQRQESERKTSDLLDFVTHYLIPQ